jgi:hypothetical protein
MITQMSGEDCQELLLDVSTGRLACSLHDQPYVVPIQFAAEPGHLYGFSTLGQKVEWMRQNPHVCILVDRIDHPGHWESVIVTGLYEEISPMNGYERQRDHAWSLLRQHANWWEPAYQETRIGDVDRPLLPVFYRVAVTGLTGRRCRTEEHTHLPRETSFFERLIQRIAPGT